MRFVEKIQSGYKNVTYHNQTHGADVSQTAYYYMMSSTSKGQSFYERAKIDDIELAALIIGGVCHDHEHPGFNNVYLIETKHEIAQRYNDVSVLENHHVASTFAVLAQEEFNILKKFERPEYKKFRQKMINLILATDMSKHFGEQGKFKSRITAEDFNLETNQSDRDLCMSVMFHLADISNPAKKFEISHKWTELLYVEFF